MDYGQKSFMLMLRCHQSLSGFLAEDHLPQMSYQSLQSVNDKDDNEKIPEIVHRCTGIYPSAEENCAKPQLRDCLMKFL